MHRSGNYVPVDSGVIDYENVSLIELLWDMIQ
jgi:hypothetical protein